MVDYERVKKEEVEVHRSKMELEIGRLDSENKLLTLKIEQVNHENLEKV